MLEQLSQFRFDLYNALPKRADAALDLLDALASTPSAKSVVELSLSPHFRRKFPSVSSPASLGEQEKDTDDRHRRYQITR